MRVRGEHRVQGTDWLQRLLAFTDIRGCLCTAGLGKRFRKSTMCVYIYIYIYASDVAQSVLHRPAMPSLFSVARLQLQKLQFTMHGPLMLSDASVGAAHPL